MRFICVLAVLTVAIAFSQTLPSTQPAGDPVERLQNASVFALGGIGFAGQLTQDTKDYWQVLKTSTAEANFEKILATGNPQARAYALTAIHQLDPARFQVLSTPFRNSAAKVHTARGCILSIETLGQLVQGLEKTVRTSSL